MIKLCKICKTEKLIVEFHSTKQTRNSELYEWIDCYCSICRAEKNNINYERRKLKANLIRERLMAILVIVKTVQSTDYKTENLI